MQQQELPTQVVGVVLVKVLEQLKLVVQVLY
jgi:hypothetical protein